MNANELAEIIEHLENARYMGASKAATMLRQQQAEIEALNQRIERMIEKQSHHESMAHAGGFEAGRELGMKQERERNNEPVAWMQEFECSKTGQKRRRLEFEQIGIDDIPLYTHQYERPHNTVLVPCDKLAEMQAEKKALKAHLVKKLTDEEIRHIQAQCHLKDVGYDGFIMRFARAILLKAQEV